MLRTAGYSVEAFPSARSFLEDYDPRRGGCLLLDIRMPQMTGSNLSIAVSLARLSTTPGLSTTPCLMDSLIEKPCLHGPGRHPFRASSAGRVPGAMAMRDVRARRIRPEIR